MLDVQVHVYKVTSTLLCVEGTKLNYVITSLADDVLLPLLNWWVTLTVKSRKYPTTCLYEREISERWHRFRAH